MIWQTWIQVITGQIYMFADDAKICRHIICTDNYQILQDTVDRIQHWSDVWMLKLNMINVRLCHMVDKSKRINMLWYKIIV